MNKIEQAICTGAHLKKVAARIKAAAGAPLSFAWIGDTPEINKAFPDNRLEADYQIQHPVLTALHPITYGGGALGGALGYAARGSTGAALGASAGLLAGSLAEGAIRYRHLMRAREQLLAGKDPTDPRFSLDQFTGKHASLDMISMLPTIGGHFADHRLERDYTMRHPVIATFHPGPYAGGLAGAALGAALHKAAPGTGAGFGMLAGGTVGLLAEGAARAQYLLEARRKMLNRQNPIDTRFTFSQF